MLQNYAEQLDAVNTNIIDIANDVLESNKIILESLKECDKDILDSAKKNLKNINSRTTSIDNDIIKILALFAPEAKDLRLIISFFKITNELLRASTNTRSFIKSFSEYCYEVDIDTIKQYAIPLQEATIEALEGVVEMIKTDDDEIQDSFNKVLLAEKKTDELYDTLQDNVLKLEKTIEDFDKYSKVLTALRKSEKIADRALDMAYLLLFAKVGGTFGQVEN